MRQLSIAIILAVISFATQAEQASSALLRKLKEMYPSTAFGTVTPVGAMPGLFEVAIGNNVIYTNHEGRFFIFGHLYDMKEQVDLTAQRKTTAPPPSAKVEFEALPFHDAIKTVRGDGSRKIAVFADPNCGYCRRFEADLAKIDNITVFTFLIPILSDDSQRKSAAVWCANNKAQAWADLMRGPGFSVTEATCDTGALDRNKDLALRHGIRGTPTSIFTSGKQMTGAITASALSTLLEK